MEIEVKYDQLYDLGEKMLDHNIEFEKDLAEIENIAESLSSVLQGMGYSALYSRIKNFNNNEFRKIVDYTKILGNIVNYCAKTYNSEENEFEENMKREA